MNHDKAFGQALGSSALGATLQKALTPFERASHVRDRAAELMTRTRILADRLVGVRPSEANGACAPAPGAVIPQLDDDITAINRALIEIASELSRIEDALP